MKNLTSNDHGFGEGLSSSWDDEEFLECKFISSMFSSVDDVETGNGECIRSWVSCKVSIMLP
jgi:hypothetical protein